MPQDERSQHTATTYSTDDLVNEVNEKGNLGNALSTASQQFVNKIAMKFPTKFKIFL